MKKFFAISFASFCLSLFIFSILSFANQTMSNYYPSPSGNYAKVRLVNANNTGWPNQNTCFCAQNSSNSGGWYGGSVGGKCDVGEPSSITYLNTGTIFADPVTGYLEICKNDGTAASYPGACFTRFGSFSTHSTCPSNYTLAKINNSSTAIVTSMDSNATKVLTWSCCYTGPSSGANISKSGCFSILSYHNQPPPCSYVDNSAYDVGCDNVGTSFKRNCCYNSNSGSLTVSSVCSLTSSSCVPSILNCTAGNSCAPGTDGCSGSCACPSGQSCVSGTCTACVPSTPICPVNGSCAAGSDGCSGSCACPVNQACTSGICTTTCTPVLTCPANTYCGPTSDGCVGTCSCPANQVCDSSATCSCPLGDTWNGSTCVAACVPVATCSANGSCGANSNSCGGTCSCPANQVCTSGICGCPAGDTWNGSTCAAACVPNTPTCNANASCAAGTDGCSGSCACPANQVCTSGTCACPAGDTWNGSTCVTPCVPSIINCSANASCAAGTDGCSGSCACPANQTCTSGTCACPAGDTWNGSTCVSACTPTTCAALGDNCNSVSDGCSGTLNCGSCPPAGQPTLTSCIANHCVNNSPQCSTTVLNSCVLGAVITTYVTNNINYWICKANSMTVICSQTSGICGAGLDSCIAGTEAAGGTPNSWTCQGNNGGSNASCCAPTSTCAANGSCGANSDTCGGVCSCPANQVCSSGTCACPTGDTWNGNTCVANCPNYTETPACGSGVTFNSASNGTTDNPGCPSGCASGSLSGTCTNGSWSITDTCAAGVGINCVGAWGACSGGSQTYTITTPASGGGANCPNNSNDTRPCGTTGACGTDRDQCSSGIVAQSNDDGTNTTWICASTDGGTESPLCSASDTCTPTTPCPTSGNQCGFDSCGNSCGTCMGTSICNTNTGIGTCVACTPSCPGTAKCGDSDGCGGTCSGPCKNGNTCTLNIVNGASKTYQCTCGGNSTDCATGSCCNGFCAVSSCACSNPGSQDSCGASECCGSNSICSSLQNDNNNCGSCGKTCNTNNGEQCINGNCTCNGLVCPGSTPNCVNGICKASPGTPICSAANPCSSGTCCSSLCTDTTADPNNCGGCGSVCTPPDSCTLPQCSGSSCVNTSSCVGGTSCCPGGCTDLTTSSNCGACGNACAAGQTCTNGQCTCDPSANPSDCPSTGCQPMICSGGLCVPQAAPNCSSGDGCIQDQCISLATGSGPGSYVCEHTPTCPCPGVDCNITVTATRIDTGICADGSGNPVGCPTCSDQVCTTASTGPGLCGGDSYLPPEPYCNKYYVGTGLNLVTYCKIEGPGLTGDYPTPPSFPGDGAICFMPTGGFALCSAGGTSSCTPGEALAPPGSYYTN